MPIDILSKLKSTAGSTLVAALLINQAARADTNFHFKPLLSSYMLGAEEAACGEGKCGISMMDTNKDGKVSLEEAKAVDFSEKQFKAWDLNHDGVLDKSELDAMHSVKGKEGYCSVDPS